MNYLELVQRLRRKCRVAGANPATVQGVPNEETARLADWINEALFQIQSLRQDWPWMRGAASFQTLDGQAEYTLAQIGVADLADWDTRTFRSYKTDAGIKGEVFMTSLVYADWRDLYQYGNLRTQRTQPLNVTVLPNRGLGLGPTPQAGYTVLGEYWRLPQTLKADTDVPRIPEQYHMAIVYKAMSFYGASEAAAEVYQEGEVEYKRMLMRMLARELTPPSLGWSFA